MSVLEPGDAVIFIDGKGRRYLTTLRSGGEFHFHRGIVFHDALIGQAEGRVVESTGGERVTVLRPTLEEFVLKMGRGAQVVYPKDLGAIIVAGDIYPGATVLEAGAGSGALTMALVRAVGSEGRVISYELREDHAAIAAENVARLMGKLDNLEIRVGDVGRGLDAGSADRVVLDLPEPWGLLEPVAAALRPGGVLTCYLPTVLQVAQLEERLQADPRFFIPRTIETLVRSWKFEGRSVRPDHRMVGHTGFITTSRRIAP